MASTYTPLGVEKMATGENAGTWGTKTNTNLQIIEQFAGGFTQQAVTDGADTDLSVTDGNTGATLAHRVIEFTGTLSASRNVTIPIDVQTFYLIKNSCTDVVVFKYVSGSGNSVTLQSGDMKMVYATANHGTNPDIDEWYTNRISGTLTVGVDDTGYDVKFFGATSGKYMLWDESADSLLVSGVITGDTIEATADTSSGDNAAIGYTSAEGLILTGQGSTSDVTIKNDADATVLSIPTGTSNVGIGTTTPSEALEVNGTIKATALDVTGTILQVVNSTVGMTDIAGTDAYIGAGCSITPSSTSSKIQIFVDGYVEKITGVTATYAQLALYEDTTGITTLSNAITYLYTVGARVPFSINFTRSPSTTSAVQYRLYNDEQSGGATYRYYQQAWTLMEVAG